MEALAGVRECGSSQTLLVTGESDAGFQRALRQDILKLSIPPRVTDPEEILAYVIKGS